jgi:hypothetical protein
MQPIATLPMNDPEGRLFPHLQRITPDLKYLFSAVFISVPLLTQQLQPEKIRWLKSEPFYKGLYYQEPLSIGDQFLTLNETAARRAAPGQIVHLCYPDRVAFALQTKYRQQFMADVSSLSVNQTPLIFERSAAAWETHPRNYYELEQMVNDTAKWLFGRSLDYAWCHMALPAETLLTIIPTITRRDMAHVAEYILFLQDEIQTRTVDWLAWEDPFIFAEDTVKLKAKRENSLEETQKRLDYVIPMLHMLTEAGGQKAYF